MPVRVKVVGTDQFHQLARELKRAGDGRMLREMSAEMKRAADPIVQDMQSTVQGVTTLGGSRGGGGASARAARAQRALRGRRNASERVKQRAFRRSGLRATVARTVKPSVSTGGRSASVTIKSRSSLMPVDQRRLPMHMNRGRWRHPTFGDDPWVVQVVTPGWFDKPARRGGPRVRQRAFGVVLRTLNKLGS